MLLPPVVKLLRSLTERDSSLRHRLAHETDIYFALFRCQFILVALTTVMLCSLLRLITVDSNVFSWLDGLILCYHDSKMVIN